MTGPTANAKTGWKALWAPAAAITDTCIGEQDMGVRTTPAKLAQADLAKSDPLPTKVR